MEGNNSGNNSEPREERKKRCAVWYARASSVKDYLFLIVEHGILFIIIIPPLPESGQIKASNRSELGYL